VWTVTEISCYSTKYSIGHKKKQHVAKIPLPSLNIRTVSYEFLKLLLLFIAVLSILFEFIFKNRKIFPYLANTDFSAKIKNASFFLTKYFYFLRKYFGQKL
jgi:hypothetical protein